MKVTLALMFLMSAQAFAQMGSGSPISESAREEIHRRQENRKLVVLSECKRILTETQVDLYCGASANRICKTFVKTVAPTDLSYGEIRKILYSFDCK